MYIFIIILKFITFFFFNFNTRIFLLTYNFRNDRYINHVKVTFFYGDIGKVVFAVFHILKCLA